MKISVGILSWNTSETIHRTLETLNEELEDVCHEILVVDQASVDDTLEVIKYWSSNWNPSGYISYYHNMKNIGISRGKNKAIDEAQGEHILLIDGDVVPVKNSILLMSQWLDENQDKHAIGMYPNRWTDQHNKNGQAFYETYCEELYDVKEHNGACLFYGMYRSSVFDQGLRCCEEGEFGDAGYGWEDTDFFYVMKSMGIKQYVAHINNPQGHYYHRINSSLKNKDCLPPNHYQEHFNARKNIFRKRWKDGS